MPKNCQKLKDTLFTAMNDKANVNIKQANTSEKKEKKKKQERINW